MDTNKTFTFINSETLCSIIESATKHIIYAAPSIAESVAQSLCNFTRRRSDNGALRVIIDADAESLRLGFGEHNGLKPLASERVDIRCAHGLRIAVLVADENAWIYSPTPEIIFQQPDVRISNAI